MKAHKLALLAGMILFAACGGDKKEPENNKTTTVDVPLTDTVLPRVFYKRFEGSIAGKAVVMHLQRAGDLYDGIYYYLDQGKWLLLRYQKDSSNDTDISFTETIAITINTEQDAAPPDLRMHYANGTLKGSWKNKDGKTFPIDLKETYPEGSFRFLPQLFVDTAVAFSGKTNSPVARISESFPVATGTSDTTWLNARMKKILDFDTTAATTFEQDANKSHAAYLKSYLDETKKMNNEDAVAFLNYEQGQHVTIRFNKNGLIIFESLYYAYEGGAHGNYGTRIFCYDVKNKTAIRLKDIINADTAALQPIVEKNFRLQMGLKPGVALNTVLFENRLAMTDNFYFTEKGIGFIYDPYEIASYAQGTINIFVPFTDLQPYLNTALVQRIR